MKKPVFLILAITAFYLGYAFVLQLLAGGNSAELTILYTGNTFGELKPCGCAKEVDLGGVERRETYFKEIRRAGKNILLLDTGDDFKEPTQQGKIKARFLMKSMALMGYDAVMPGDKDLVYGNRFIGELKDNGVLPGICVCPSTPRRRQFRGIDNPVYGQYLWRTQTLRMRQGSGFGWG